MPPNAAKNIARKNNKPKKQGPAFLGKPRVWYCPKQASTLPQKAISPPTLTVGRNSTYELPNTTIFTLKNVVVAQRRPLIPRGGNTSHLFFAGNIAPLWSRFSSTQAWPNTRPQLRGPAHVLVDNETQLRTTHNTERLVGDTRPLLIPTCVMQCVLSCALVMRDAQWHRRRLALRRAHDPGRRARFESSQIFEIILLFHAEAS